MVKCPICGEYEFECVGDYDICNVCFWENDGIQYDDPDYSGGANRLSQNEYKLRWQKIEQIVPPLIEKFGITKVKTLCEERYGGLIVPIQHIQEFIEIMNENKIELRLDFYNLCRKYNYNDNNFIGFVFTESETIKGNNDEILNIILSKNIIETCEKYNLKQVVQILKKSKNRNEWGENFPCIEILVS